MSFYVLLTIATLLVLAISWGLWKATGSVAFLFGMAVMYFWSLYGGWAIVTDQLGGDSEKHYHYLYERMFPVCLDGNYFWTLTFYTLFITIVGLTALAFIRKAPSVTDRLNPIVVSHDRIVLIGSIAALLSLWIVQDSISAAVLYGRSAYVITRWESDDLGLFRIHQVLNRFALVPSALGMATLMSSGKCKYLVAQKTLRHYIGYSLLLGFMFCFCVVLGNKNELALALFAGCFFYLANSTKPKTLQLATCGVALLACVGFIDFVRALSINEITRHISIGEILSSLSRLADSNEAFAAHMSMYGVLHYETPFTFGSSIYSLIASAIPRALWPGRPDDIYWYYADCVGLITIAEGQGYTIHHGTGWYLNFGVAGLIFGASLLGAIWATLYNNVARGAVRKGATAARISSLIGFFTFSAYLPTLIRSGPEGYKGVVVDALVAPIIVLSMSRMRSVKMLRRPFDKISVRPAPMTTQHNADRTAA